MYVLLASPGVPSLRRAEVPRRGGDHPATAAFRERRIPAGSSGAPAVGRAPNVIEPFLSCSGLSCHRPAAGERDGGPAALLKIS